MVHQCSYQEHLENARASFYMVWVHLHTSETAANTPTVRKLFYTHWMYKKRTVYVLLTTVVAISTSCNQQQFPRRMLRDAYIYPHKNYKQFKETWNIKWGKSKTIYGFKLIDWLRRELIYSLLSNASKKHQKHNIVDKAFIFVFFFSFSFYSLLLPPLP